MKSYYWFWIFSVISLILIVLLHISRIFLIIPAVLGIIFKLYAFFEPKDRKIGWWGLGIILLAVIVLWVIPLFGALKK